MVSKLDRMLKYLDGFMAIKSHDPLFKWSSKIM